MAAHPDRRSKTPGYHRGVGTTSTGVHYDLRPEDSLTDAGSVREEALRIARQRMARATPKKKSASARKMRPAALGAAVLLLFAGAATFFGDQIWDTVTLPAPTVVTSAPRAPTQAPTARSSQTAVPAVATAEPAIAPKVGAVADAVYLPRTGTRYHANSQCSGMKDATEVMLQEAIDQGYLPCKRCKPPQ